MKNLFEILIGDGDENQEVLCGLWEGYGQSYLSRSKAKFESYSVYRLFNTTLAGVRVGWLAAHEYSLSKHGIGTDGSAPNAVWPTTREWYLAVDYNLRATYIGGPVNLIDSIRSAADFETHEALPGDNIF